MKVSWESQIWPRAMSQYGVCWTNFEIRTFSVLNITAKYCAVGRRRFQIFRRVLIVRCTYVCQKYLENSTMFTCPIGESDMILSLHEFKKLEMQLSNSPAKKKKKKIYIWDELLLLWNILNMAQFQWFRTHGIYGPYVVKKVVFREVHHKVLGP